MTETPTHTPLPCPFCGGEARLRTVKLPMPYDCDDVCYYCTDCDVDGPHMLFDQSTHTVDDLPDLEAEALTAWNTRADSHHRLIEAAQAMLPRNLNLADWLDDSAVIPMDVTVSELRELSAALKEAGR